MIDISDRAGMSERPCTTSGPPGAAREWGFGVHSPSVGTHVMAAVGLDCQPNGKVIRTRFGTASAVPRSGGPARDGHFREAIRVVGATWEGSSQPDKGSKQMEKAGIRRASPESSSETLGVQKRPGSS